LEIATELDIVRQEARATSVGGIDVHVPEYLAEVIVTLSHLARASTHVNQRSGVSVRLSVTNYEVVAANALRRGLRAGERVVVPRVDDLDALAASSGGKIEIESLDEGREGAVFDNLVKSAVLTVFKSRVAPEQTRDIVTAFEEGVIAHTGEDIASTDLAGLVESVPALRAPVASLAEGDESPAAVAAAVTFVLEGLHLSKRLNKDTSGTSATYRSRS
ncbi:MAG: magnesium chelatase, partial [Ilumatobacteraceae bacterium]